MTSKKLKKNCIKYKIKMNYMMNRKKKSNFLSICGSFFVNDKISLKG